LSDFQLDIHITISITQQLKELIENLLRCHSSVCVV